MPRLNNFARAAALTVLAALVSSAPSRAAEGDYVQGAVCGTAKAEFFQTNIDTHVTIDRKGTMWRGTTNGADDKCGVIFGVGDHRHVMRGDRATEIMFDTLNEDAKKDIMVTLVFKPQLGLKDLITVTKPLNDFRFSAWAGHPMAMVSSKDVFNQAGVPDLRKLVITVSGKNQVVLRHVNFETESTNWKGEIRLKNADCAALDPSKQ